jgi:Mce-associated membrane protein
VPVKADAIDNGADPQTSMDALRSVDDQDTGDDEGFEVPATAADDTGEVGSRNVDPKPRHRFAWPRVLVFGLLPVVALLLALGAGYLKWQYGSSQAAVVARIESVQTAKDSTIALLSYRPDSVDKDLAAARDRLTGNFRDSYTSLTKDVVIPGAKQKQISAVATVPAAASVSANENHAVVLAFVDQTVMVGNGAPSSTASAVRVTLDKVDGRWLISGFEPV